MIRLIKNLKLYTQPDRTTDMLIAGGRIEQIEKDMDYPRAITEVTDAGGRLAFPGYFDQHVHITGGGGEGGFINKVPELQLSQAIASGITSLVGLLGTDGVTRSVENLVAKAKALNDEGISAWCLTGSYEQPSPTITGSVKKDIVFIKEIIGVKIAIADHRSSGITRDELIRLGADARTAGIISGKAGVVHLHVGRGKNGLGLLFDALEQSDIAISTFRPTHLGKCYEDAIRFAKRGGYIDFTAGDPLKTASLLERAMREAPPELVTISSDGNGSMPKWNGENELVGMDVGSVSVIHKTVVSLMRDHGFTAERALLPCTLNPARALGFDGSKGSLACGRDADVLLLDDDLNIDTVFAKGRKMMQDKRILVKGRFEN